MIYFRGLGTSLEMWFRSLCLAGHDEVYLRTGSYRWSSIENFDLLRMETILPSIFDEFMCGHFVAWLTTSLFAGMALDQVLEQLNCKIKAVLGGLNLLNRDDEGKSLLSWALSCPEILRLLEEYEKKPNAGTTEHHSNNKQLQLDYKEDCLKFKSSWMCCL